MIADERAAVSAALDSMQPSELVVVFYDDHHEVHEVVRAAGATPVVGGLSAMASHPAADSGPAMAAVVDRRHNRRPTVTSFPEQWA